MFTPLAVLPESGLTTKLAQCAGQRTGTSASVCGQAYCCGVLTYMLNARPGMPASLLPPNQSTEAALVTGAAPDTLCMKPTPEPTWRSSDVGGVSTGDLTPSAIAKAYPRNLLLTSACLWRHGTLVRAQPPHRVVVVGGAKGKLWHA